MHQEQKRSPGKDDMGLGPIILAHGVLGFNRIFFIRYFNGVLNLLRESGFEAYSNKVSKAGSIAKRANELKETILSIPELSDRLKSLEKEKSGVDTGSRKVPGLNIIAHSMGGLDARYMITHLGMATYVDSLTTISTPHTSDPVIDLIPSALGEELKIIDIFKKLFIDMEAFGDLTTQSILEFNENTPNVPGVKYFSYAGAKDYIHRREFFHTSFMYLTENFGPNEGLVTVEGSKWGTYVRTINADHLEQIGWGNFMNIPENLKVPEKLRKLSLKFIRRFNDGYFDHLSFYLEMAEMLSREMT